MSFIASRLLLEWTSETAKRWQLKRLLHRTATSLGTAKDLGRIFLLSPLAQPIEGVEVLWLIGSNLGGKTGKETRVKTSMLTHLLVEMD